VKAAASTLRDGAGAGGSSPTLERPPNPEFGDYSTNAAMLLAPALGEQPRRTAWYKPTPVRLPVSSAAGIASWTDLRRPQA
jgi:arginyl-tRNA synthetase